MEERDVRDLETIFAQVEDPRIERTKRHRLRDIISIVVLTQKNVEGKLEGVDPTQEGKDHAKDPTNLYERI